MAAKGTIAKSNIEKKLLEVFGDDALVFNKKLYVWADDGGERVQIAISMTCPKNEVTTVNIAAAVGEGHDFSQEQTVVAQTGFTPAEITEEEKQNVADMLAALGL